MSNIERLGEAARWSALADRLATWLPSRRWFQGKARTVTGVAVDDVALLPGDPPVADVLLSVDYRRGASERYQVPLVAAAGGGLPIADLVVADALEDPAAARTLARQVLATAGVETVGGAVVRGAPVGEPPSLPEPARPLRAEQSNSSVVFGDALLLKVFRKLEAGLNPDVELTRGLTEAGFAHVPAQVAALFLEGATDPSALAVLTAFRRDAKDAWDLALGEVEAARRGTAAAPLAGRSHALGRVVGELHRTLERRFGTRDVDRADLAAWMRDMHAQLDEVAATVAEHPSAGERLLEVADGVRERIDALAELEDAGSAIRVHGDLHLGQVLLDNQHGWQILDFEGEPARPLAERRLPHSPIRDVAGMLRSFDYAAAHGAAAHEQAPPAVVRWRDEGREAFLAGYLEVCGSSRLLPRAAEAQGALIDAFELDKAVYELGYELANRPAWVPIPLAGILRLLEHDSLSPSNRRQEGAA